MEICAFCRHECDSTRDNCEHCGQPAKFPNVVAATKPEEEQAIDSGYASLIAMAGGTIGSILEKFESIVRNQSKAVLVRPIGEVVGLFARANNLHQPFHQRLRAGGVHFDKGKYDVHRPSVDGKLFPNYLDRITSASLSLERTGAGGTYGQCHMTLRTSMVEHRASVFNGNSFEVISKLGLKPNESVPTGLRSSWGRRGKLAASKDASKFSDKTSEAEFPSILNDGDNDFVEVHVYGSISHRTIERIVVVPSRLEAVDKIFAKGLKSMMKKMSNSDATWTTVFEEV